MNDVNDVNDVGDVGEEALRPDEVLSADEARRRRQEDPQVSPFADGLAWLLDESIPIPGTNRRIGLDGLIGLIPGVGDGAGFVASLFIILRAVARGVSTATIVKMFGNVLVESVVGTVPVVGDAFDLAWKSNSRNLRLTEADLADPERTRRSSIATIVGSVLVTLGLLAVVGAAFAAGAWLLVRTIEVIF